MNKQRGNQLIGFTAINRGPVVLAEPLDEAKHGCCDCSAAPMRLWQIILACDSQGILCNLLDVGRHLDFLRGALLEAPSNPLLLIKVHFFMLFSFHKDYWVQGENK